MLQLMQLVQSPHLRVKICQVKKHQQLDHPSWIFHGLVTTPWPRSTAQKITTCFLKQGVRVIVQGGTTEEVYVVSGKQIKAKYQDLFLTLILCKLTCQYANFQSMATVPTPGPCAMGEASESGKEQNEVVDVEVITLQGKRFKVSDVPWLAICTNLHMFAPLNRIQWCSLELVFNDQKDWTPCMV